VQGVGFRPFVFRLAGEHGLTGWVRNRMGVVEICTQGDPGAQEAFCRSLLERAPPLAHPAVLATEDTLEPALETFTILASESGGPADIHVPPDCFTCDDCLGELRDPGDRRFRYPFINCTQCGPRYTLIEALPYDRANTSMAGFTLCGDCAREYADPGNRRFHAEPVACPRCGPALSFVADGEPVAARAEALAACVTALRSGDIVAVKGIGGYHLLCDARCGTAVERLRSRKKRPHKPLAVMFPSPPDRPMAALLEELQPDPAEARLLLSPERPIVLVPRRAGCTLAAAIAPGLPEVGAMLPYSPLHHLLLDAFDGPLVATSGNLSGEPVLTDNAEAQQRLAGIATAFLHHDRPIVRPADDAVYRRLLGAPRPIRLGRGCAPLELALPFELARPVLAVGGHMKNTVALGWGRRAAVSPHIGDMGSERSMAVFSRVCEDLQALYGVRAERLLCDAHPDYPTARWARRSGLPVTPLFHHRAHASALAGEVDPGLDWLVFTWDGVGYGEDGTLWGGEALAGRPGAWRRVASMRPFHLPGGDRAAREPWRSAAALCWETGRPWTTAAADGSELPLLQHAWQRGLNAPETSAVGRLFDAAAALTGTCERASFEGQGPMLLEALCTAPGQAVPLPLARDTAGLWRSDWEPLLAALLDKKCDPGEQAARVHATLARALVEQARAIRRERPVAAVGLAGGVFQNRVLTALACEWLQAEGFTVHLGQRLPVNDAGLCFGQLIEWGAGETGDEE